MRGSITPPETLLFEYPVYSPDQGDTVKYVSGPPPPPQSLYVTGLLLEVICDLIGQCPQVPRRAAAHWRERSEKERMR